MPDACPRCQSPIPRNPATGEAILCPSCGTDTRVGGATIIGREAKRTLGKFDLIEEVVARVSSRRSR